MNEGTEASGGTVTKEVTISELEQEGKRRMEQEKAKREAAEKRRYNNYQRKHGTPTERAVICYICHKGGGTLLHSADGYIHRDCQRRLDTAARRGQ